MTKVFFRTAMVAVIVSQSACAPLYKGLWLDKILDEPTAALSGGAKPYVVPAAPVQQVRSPVARSATTQAAPVASAPATPILILTETVGEDKGDRYQGGPSPTSDRRQATGPSSKGPGSGPNQVVHGGPQSIGAGSGPSQVAKGPVRTTR